MSNVPYIFADDTGNIPLSQLDANFANAKSAADYVIANTQANITSLGVLTSLSVTGNINGSATTFYTGNGRQLTGVLATSIGVIEELSVLGNITSGNVSAIGNIRTGNVNLSGQVSATGNITGQYLKGNGSFLTGIVTTFNANALTGNTLSGNVLFSNLTTVGTLNNLEVSSFVQANQVYATEYYGTTIELVSMVIDSIESTQIQNSGEIVSTGNIITTGNISGSYFIGNGRQLTGVVATSVGTLPSLNVTGNVQSGNLVTSGNLVLGGRINVAGNVSAVGNITGNYILGNGALLTGITGGTTNAASLTGNILSPNVTQSSLTSVGLLSNLSVAGNINLGGALRDNNELNIVTTANNSNIVLTPNGTGQVQVDSGLAVNGSVSSGATISAVGNITTTGFFVGNFSGNIVGTLTNIPGPGGAVVYNDGSGNAAATAGLVYTTGPNVLTVLGNLVSDGIVANSISGPLSTASQANITTVGTLTTLSVTGNITTAANIAGGFILGNGSQLTGISSGVTNAGLLTGNTLSGNVLFSNLTSVGTLTTLSTAGNITTTANISGGFIFGNGSQLTGITGGTSNAALLTGTTLSANVVNSSLTTVGSLTTLSVVGNINLGGSITDSGQLDIQTTAGNANINLTPNGSGLVRVTSALSVAGNIIAPNLIGAGFGTPTISSNSNLILSAPTAVTVSGGGVFRLPGLTSAQIANLTAVNGDMVYNSTINKFQGYENGAWGNLI